MNEAVRRVCGLFREEGGFSLVELLIVIAILGIVLGGLTDLFTSGTNSELDQNNRVQAQQQARVSLDKLRRELHCSSGITASSTSPVYSITFSVPGYCPALTSTTLSSSVTVTSTAYTVPVASLNGYNSGANQIVVGSDVISCTGTNAAAVSFTGCTGGTVGNSYVSGMPVGTSVTWCVSGSAAPYSLERYTGGTATASPNAPTSYCSGAGGVAEVANLYSPAFYSYSRTAVVPAPSVAAVSGGSLAPGTYYYDVTAVTTGGEVSGTVTPCVVTPSSGNYTCQITLPSYGATSFNVYGRDDGTTTPNSTEVPQGLRLLWACAPPTACTSTTTFKDDGSIDTEDSSLERPPLGTLGVSLVVDPTPAKGTQRFTLIDNVVLRNASRY